MRIGITGESGFIGSSLKNYLSLNQDINIIKFNKKKKKKKIHWRKLTWEKIYFTRRQTHSWKINLVLDSYSTKIVLVEFLSQQT